MLPYASITWIRFFGSASLPRHPLSLEPTHSAGLVGSPIRVEASFLSRTRQATARMHFKLQPRLGMEDSHETCLVQSIAGAGIEIRPKSHVQLMHRECQPCINIGDLLVDRVRLEMTAHFPEAKADGSSLVGISQFTQQPSDFVRELACLPNRFSCRFDGQSPFCDRFEKRALELPASLWTIQVDAAILILAERRARLRKLPELRRLGWKTSFTGGGGLRSDGDSERLQPSRIVSGLKLHVLEERAVTAKTATQAETLENFLANHSRFAGVHQIFARSSIGRHCAAPSLMPKASKNS